MRYIKLPTKQHADAYREKLQQYHDETADQRPGQPKIVDCVVPTWDGQYAVTLEDEDLTSAEAVGLPQKIVRGKVMARKPIPPITIGTIIDTLDPPKQKMELPKGETPVAEDQLPK